MGAINLNNTGSGSAITLSSDGSSLLLNGSAVGGGGGGGADLYTANESSATANTVTGTNAVAIGSNNTASGESSLSFGVNATASQVGAFAAGRNTTASGADSFAFGASAVASGSNTISIGSNTDATGNSSVSIGNTAQSSGGYSVALGKAYASGADSLAAAIGTNSASYGATGANSVALGQQAKATNQKSVGIGYFASSEGLYSTAIGRQSEAKQELSIALGGWAKSNIIAKVAIGGYTPNNAGESQTGIYNLFSDTTDATAEALTTNNSTAGSLNQIILPNNSAYAFHGTIVARQQAADGTACAAWKVEGLIRREANAGTTVLVNSATTVLDNTPSWGTSLSADTSNGGLKIQVTGAASTDIRWNASISTSEVTYA